MMVKVVKKGEFVIRIYGDHAKAYDRRSGRKLFDGSVEEVMRDIQAKIEGEMTELKRRKWV